MILKRHLKRLFNTTINTRYTSWPSRLWSVPIPLEEPLEPSTSSPFFCFSCLNGYPQDILVRAIRDGYEDIVAAMITHTKFPAFWELPISSSRIAHKYTPHQLKFIFGNGPQSKPRSTSSSQSPRGGTPCETCCPTRFLSLSAFPVTCVPSRPPGL